MPICVYSIGILFITFYHTDYIKSIDYIKILSMINGQDSPYKTLRHDPEYKKKVLLKKDFPCLLFFTLFKLGLVLTAGINEPAHADHSQAKKKLKNDKQAD